jgi:hypothetical protein
MIFGMKNFNMNNNQKRNKKTLIFKNYKLMDLMEWGFVTFWGRCPTRWLQDPVASFVSLYLIIFEKMKGASLYGYWSRRQRIPTVWLVEIKSLTVGPSH